MRFFLPHRFIFFILVALILLGTGMFFLHLFPNLLPASQEKRGSFYLLLLLAFLGYSLFKNRTHSFWHSFLHVTLWSLIFIALLTGYSYRYTLYRVKDQLVGSLIPARPIATSQGALQFRIANDGHYYIQAEIEGHNVTFMLDTGASDIVLSPAVAEELGITPGQLIFNKRYETANGTIRGASVLLPSMTIGTFTLHNIYVSVNEADMQTPLLGMRFLEMLKGYEVKEGILTLYP